MSVSLTSPFLSGVTISSGSVAIGNVVTTPNFTRADLIQAIRARCMASINHPMLGDPILMNDLLDEAVERHTPDMGIWYEPILTVAAGVKAIGYAHQRLTTCDWRYVTDDATSWRPIPVLDPLDADAATTWRGEESITGGCKALIDIAPGVGYLYPRPDADIYVKLSGYIQASNSIWPNDTDPCPVSPQYKTAIIRCGIWLVKLAFKDPTAPDEERMWRSLKAAVDANINTRTPASRYRGTTPDAGLPNTTSGNPFNW
jgi:hypothetical protein